jgi:hypothetical protein
VPATRSMLIATALGLAGSWACGQTVYRCGSSYSQERCPGGTAVDVSDPRASGDAARAGKAAAADGKRADAMEKERLAREKNAPKAVVIGPATPPAREKPAKAVAKSKKDKKGKASEAEPFTAMAPRPAGEAKKGKP